MKHMAKVEKEFVWPNNNTFGYKPRKDKEKIKYLRRWYTCSLCGRPSEVRPHSPLGSDEWMKWKFFPIRLCFFCVGIQERIRDLCKSVFKQDGN